MQYCDDFNNKSQSVKPIYVYASERSLYALLEHGVICRCLRHSLRVITVIGLDLLLTSVQNCQKHFRQFKEDN